MTFEVAAPEASTAEAPASAGASARDWESALGGKWLGRVGIVVLIVGIVLFLGFTLQNLGPLGKVAVGVAISVLLLAVGFTLAPRERYEAFVKPLLAGGWAVLYVTAYAAHNVAAARIIDSPTLALWVLFLVAAGMVGHALRYRSQGMTAGALLLAFGAVAISPHSLWSLGAAAVLVATVPVLVRSRPWYALAIAATIATYAQHAWWLARGAEDLAGPFPPEAYWVSQSLMVVYWLALTGVGFVRRAESGQRKALDLAVAGLNTAGVLAFTAWQTAAVFPGSLWVMALLAALVHGAVGALHRRYRNAHLFPLAGVVALALVAVACPLALDRFGVGFAGLALMWVVVAGAGMFAGAWLAERPIRIAAHGLVVLPVVAAMRFNLGAPDALGFVLWLTGFGLAGFLLVLAEVLPRAERAGRALPPAALVGECYGYVGTAVLAVFVHRIVDAELLGLAWLSIGLVFFEVGQRYTRPHVRVQGYGLVAAGCVALSLVNLYDAFGTSTTLLAPRWLEVLPGIAAMAWLHRRLRIAPSAPDALEQERRLSYVPSLVGTAVAAVLLWKELNIEAVAPAWALFAMLLLYAGFALRDRALRIEGYALLATACVALVVVNLYDGFGTLPTPRAARWLAVLPGILVVAWLHWRLRIGPAVRDALEAEGRLGYAPSATGTVLTAVLLWKELNIEAVAPAWALIALILFHLGRTLDDRALRLEAHAIIIGAFAWAFFGNLTSIGTVLGVSNRLVAVLPLIVLLYAFRWWLRQAGAARTLAWPEDRLATVYGYAAVLLFAALARFELGRAYAVLAWAPYLVVLSWLGLRARDFDFRVQGLLLALLSAARCLSAFPSLIGSFYGVPDRWAVTVPVVVALVAFLYMDRRYRVRLEGEPPVGGPRVLLVLHRHAGWFVSALLAALVAGFLYYEVSPDWLSIAWAGEAVVLLAVGFALMQQGLRAVGLALLLVCLVKVVVVDLSGIQTIYRIASFIVLGVVLLAASFAYTRYRETIRRYL